MSDYRIAQFSVRCDSCDQLHEDGIAYMHDTYAEAIAAAREGGWKHTKRGRDVCPFCQASES